MTLQFYNNNNLAFPVSRLTSQLQTNASFQPAFSTRNQIAIAATIAWHAPPYAITGSQLVDNRAPSTEN